MFMSAGRRRNEVGFTLIELLVAVVILGIVAVPLANTVIAFLKNTDSTTARLSESHDAQISAAYFAQDVASIGTHSTSTPYGLTQSVDSTNTVTWPYPCASPGTTPIVRFVWDDYPSGPSSVRQIRVAYVVNSAGTELHRLTCVGSATLSSDVMIAHDLNPSAAPAVMCYPALSGPTAPCEGPVPVVPAIITMTMTIKDPKNSGASYGVVLNGQRRQT
jgi:prepilin-type N-terminal cleavage/methylation domain-containing protein